MSLNTDQPISGKKTFFNDIQMGNIGGIGSITPTIINFANGSKLGDVQNINDGAPDNDGSIDLYAPDGAKWVQLNYGNNNYLGIERDGIFFEYAGMLWKFGYDEVGSLTRIPGSLVLDGLGYNASIRTEDEVDLDISSPTSISMNTNALTFSSSSLIVGVNQANFRFEDNIVQFSFPNFNNNIWNFYGDDGTTFIPSDLNIMVGNLNLHDGGIEIMEGDLKLTNGKLYTNNGLGTEGDVLTLDKEGFPFWHTPSSSLPTFTVGIDGTDFNIISNSGIHTFNIPDANISKRGLLTSSDWNTFNNKQDILVAADNSHDGFLTRSDWIVFNNKQDAIINPITGSGNSGNLSFFDGTNSLTSSSDLFWNSTKKRLGIRNNNPAYPFEINQEEDNYGFMLNSPNSNKWGSTIGFQSNIGSGTNTNTGLFQLDRDGAMVFRTLQDHMYFDNEGPGNIFFRMGKTIYGMRLDNSYNLHVDGIVQSVGTTLTSDIRLKKNILPLNKALNVIQKLNPVSYQKKQTIESDNYSINENGFIAQELQKVLPMLVHESTDKEKLLSVNYTAIIPILTKGIQEQQAQIEELKKEMKVLKKLLLDLNKKK